MLTIFAIVAGATLVTVVMRAIDSVSVRRLTACVSQPAAPVQPRLSIVSNRSTTGTGSSAVRRLPATFADVHGQSAA